MSTIASPARAGTSSPRCAAHAPQGTCQSRDAEGVAARPVETGAHAVGFGAQRLGPRPRWGTARPGRGRAPGGHGSVDRPMVGATRWEKTVTITKYITWRCSPSGWRGVAPAWVGAAERVAGRCPGVGGCRRAGGGALPRCGWVPPSGGRGVPPAAILRPPGRVGGPAVPPRRGRVQGESALRRGRALLTAAPGCDREACARSSLARKDSRVVG